MTYQQSSAHLRGAARLDGLARQVESIITRLDAARAEARFELSGPALFAHEARAAVAAIRLRAACDTLAANAADMRAFAEESARAALSADERAALGRLALALDDEDFAAAFGAAR